jgi:hypothetical protein
MFQQAQELTYQLERFGVIKSMHEEAEMQLCYLHLHSGSGVVQVSVVLAHWDTIALVQFAMTSRNQCTHELMQVQSLNGPGLQCGCG